MKTRTLLLIAATLAWSLLFVSLEPFSQWMTRALFGGGEGRLAGAFAFFVFEAPKVILLLVPVVFAVGVARTFFTPERTRALLSGKRGFTANVLAALLGTVTPFCSCSAVPLFYGFVSAGVPLGAAFSFLVSAPMVNEVAVVLLWNLFGWKVALVYVAAGLAVALAAGWAIGRLHLEKLLEDWVLRPQSGANGENSASPAPDRVGAGLLAVREVVGKVWLYVLLGIAVGAFIHGWVPDGLLAPIFGGGAWWSVPVSVAIGIPLYLNAAGSVPVVESLVAKGASLGSALAFMMSITALSLPEAILLRRAMKPKLLALYFGTVGAGIVLVGWLFNLSGMGR